MHLCTIWIHTEREGGESRREMNSYLQNTFWDRWLLTTFSFYHSWGAWCSKISKNCKLGKSDCLLQRLKPMFSNGVAPGWPRKNLRYMKKNFQKRLILAFEAIVHSHCIFFSIFRALPYWILLDLVVIHKKKIVTELAFILSHLLCF